MDGVQTIELMSLSVTFLGKPIDFTVQKTSFAISWYHLDYYKNIYNN